MARRGLTVKQRRLVRGVMEGKPLARAAKDAGYRGSKETLRVEADRTLRKPHVQAAMDKALDAAGLSMDHLVGKLKEGLNATKTVFFSRDGKMTDERKVADHATRCNALELAFRLIGALRRPDEGNSNQVVNVGEFLAIVEQNRRDPRLPPLA